jgi:hypothetical protein
MHAVRAPQVRHAPSQRFARLSPVKRDAVAKQKLIRLRKQKLPRQVFERLQDRLLCTFLKAD